jgi:hypothetical protein
VLYAVGDKRLYRLSFRQFLFCLEIRVVKTRNGAQGKKTDEKQEAEQKDTAATFVIHMP